MTRAVLDPQAADRLVKLCGMLGSTHEGERANAAAKADEFVRKLGLTWGDVIVVPGRPVTDWERMAAFCYARRFQLNEREADFVTTMSTWRGAPSERQANWLCNIYARLHSER